MKKTIILFLIVVSAVILSSSFKKTTEAVSYINCYNGRINSYEKVQKQLLKTIQSFNTSNTEEKKILKQQIQEARVELKAIDFWTRYLEPVVYNKINGPLPVEWETEVFEKYENPYKRTGSGLTLAELYLNEKNCSTDSLASLIQNSIAVYPAYSADSITRNLQDFSVFFLCNRLYLLNLASIYTTGFECPDSTRIIPELRSMMTDVMTIYNSYNQSFPDKTLPGDFLLLYKQAINFVNTQPVAFSNFDHFSFIKEYVNPLFSLNQQYINSYHVSSRSYMDFTLNNINTVFNKQLYSGQDAKGIFRRVKDEQALTELDKVGKLLFYDPILSGNNQRSCVSCHHPTEYFTDTSISTPLLFNKDGSLPRNAPSLISTPFNHLLMMDGKHISMQDQAKAVITSAKELNSSENEIVKKVLSCREYKKIFQYLLKFTPDQTTISFDHIVSAITFYYSKFSNYYSPFDDAMNDKKNIDASAKAGFNLFMSKAQCATCHFVPEFNGVKPPYINSEFEVLGVPADTSFKTISDDKGRWLINPADEMMNAFRTMTIRNTDHTMPYMHNGVFKSLRQVIDFYDAGGGSGKGMHVANQTLRGDSLHLNEQEKNNLLAFISSLNEKIIFEDPPASLPVSSDKKLNGRKPGAVY